MVRRRKRFDEDADWLPAKGRAFHLKGKQEEVKGQATQGPGIYPRVARPKGQTKNIKTDAEGMERAYAQGDVYGEGDKMYVAGSHTARDWFDDVTKIPQWQNVPTGIIPFVDFMNSTIGRSVFGTGDLRNSERYQRAKAYLVAHPEVTFIDGHSLGGSVVLQLQKDFPERSLTTFTQGAPVWDPFGRQKREIGQDKVERVSNWGDPVSMFDMSALKTTHENPFGYAPSFTHDYHNMDQAGGTLGGIPTQTQTPTKADFSVT